MEGRREDAHVEVHVGHRGEVLLPPQGVRVAECAHGEVVGAAALQEEVVVPRARYAGGDGALAPVPAAATGVWLAGEGLDVPALERRGHVPADLDVGVEPVIVIAGVDGDVKDRGDHVRLGAVGSTSGGDEEVGRSSGLVVLCSGRIIRAHGHGLAIQGAAADVAAYNNVVPVSERVMEVAGDTAHVEGVGARAPMLLRALQERGGRVAVVDVVGGAA